MPYLFRTQAFSHGVPDPSFLFLGTQIKELKAGGDHTPWGGNYSLRKHCSEATEVTSSPRTASPLDYLACLCLEVVSSWDFGQESVPGVTTYLIATDYHHLNSLNHISKLWGRKTVFLDIFLSGKSTIPTSGGVSGVAGVAFAFNSHPSTFYMSLLTLLHPLPR